MINPQLFTLLKVVAIPTGYAIILRLFFGVSTWMELFSVMSISFLICLPTAVGALAIYLSNREQVRKLWYRLFIPWIPVFAFLIITLAVALEGWACWLMVLPLFLIAASLGGLLGGYFKMKKQSTNLHISVLALLPLFMSPMEAMLGSIPGTYQAYTFIDINAPADVIWRNVTRVREISQTQDKGWLTRTLGFPRPVKAELNYEGVGAYREAIFTNGLVFHEPFRNTSTSRKWYSSSKLIHTKFLPPRWMNTW